MAKGIAVVSGSNDVVFKALETGIITAGSTLTYAQVGISGSLSVSGSNGTPSLYADENGVQISGSFAFVGDLQVTGNVFASENISASLDLEAGRDLIVGGTGSFAGDLDVEGVSNLAGTVTVEAGNLLVTAGQVSASSDVQAGGNLIAAGNLDVEGTGNIAQKLTVQAGGLEVTAGNLDVVAGDISGSSDLNIGGNLDLAGTADIGSTLTVESGGAYVTGDISGSADLLAGGNLVVAGDAEVTGSMTILGDLTVKGNTTVTVDNVSNMTIEDAIMQLGVGADASSQDVGFIFGDSNSRALIVDGGVFKLGTTSNDASGASVTVATSDGILVLGQLTASVGIDAAYAHVSGDLVVDGNITLGSEAADVITLNGQVTASADILLNGKLTASADVLLEEDVTVGTDSDDLFKVVGQIRMPIFTVNGANQVAGFPIVPDDYADNKAAYNGHMFYLTSSDNVNWTASGSWAQGNKWYFNERGDWHASFLFAE